MKLSLTLSLLCISLSSLHAANAKNAGANDQLSTYSKADSAEIVSLLKNGEASTLYYAEKLLGRP